MKSLEHAHYDHEGHELDGRKLCSIAIPQNSTTAQTVHKDIDTSLLTFDRAFDVAAIGRRSVGDVSVNKEIHHTHQKCRVSDETLGKR